MQVIPARFAINMGPVAAGLSQRGYTELQKNTASLCERWHEHLERALRSTV